MKQQKLTGYQPNYPRKALRGAAMTAAALVAIGGAAGCRGPRLQTSGVPLLPTPTEQELVLDGEVAIAEPMLQGKIAVSEPPEEELALSGDVAVPEPTERPLMTTGLPLLVTPQPATPSGN